MQLRFWCYFLLAVLPSFINGQNRDIEKIVVKYVNRDILTSIRITCNSFDDSFDPKQLQTKILTDSSYIKKMSIELDRIKYMKTNFEIDVRWKFFIFFKNNPNPTTICIDRFNEIIVNGRRIVLKKKLVELIEFFEKV